MHRIVYDRDYDTEFYCIPEGDLSDKDFGIWQEYEGSIYVSCMSCGRILKITRGDIDPGGFVSPCIVCNGGCKTHLWYKLENWRK